MEFRREQSSFVRGYAINQFSKKFAAVAEDQDEMQQQRIVRNVQTVSEVYRPHRYYRRKNAPPPDILSKVQVTLLEYGHKVGEHSDVSAVQNDESSSLEKQQSREVFNISYFLVLFKV